MRLRPHVSRFGETASDSFSYARRNLGKGSGILYGGISGSLPIYASIGIFFSNMPDWIINHDYMYNPINYLQILTHEAGHYLPSVALGKGLTMAFQKGLPFAENEEKYYDVLLPADIFPENSQSAIVDPEAAIIAGGGPVFEYAYALGLGLLSRRIKNPFVNYMGRMGSTLIGFRPLAYAISEIDFPLADFGLLDYYGVGPEMTVPATLALGLVNASLNWDFHGKAKRGLRSMVGLKNKQTYLKNQSTTSFGKFRKL